MKLWMVTCDFSAGHDYGVAYGLVGIFSTEEKANNSVNETVDRLHKLYKWDRSTPESSYEAYVYVTPIEVDQVYGCKVDDLTELLEDVFYGPELRPDIRLGCYFE